MPEELNFDNSRREQKIVLHDLFDGQVSPQSAATSLAAITLPGPVPGPANTNEDEAEEALAHIEGMWHNIISSLEEAPEHAKTVCDLIIWMSQLQPALTVSGDQFCDSEPRQRVWEDIPRLGWSLRDEWSGRSSCPVPSYAVERSG
jgi:hypothetical protein